MSPKQALLKSSYPMENYYTSYHLLIQYSGRENDLIEEAKIPIKGIRVQGNFLFDNPTSKISLLFSFKKRL